MVAEPRAPDLPGAQQPPRKFTRAASFLPGQAAPLFEPRAVERQLDIAQCDDRERVLYAAGQLRGAALDWWESHPVHDREALTWLQFRERFRSHNVPAGVMKMKQKEFLALKQVILSIIIQRFLLS